LLLTRILKTFRAVTISEKNKSWAWCLVLFRVS
jgi:hypothetical protein